MFSMAPPPPSPSHRPLQDIADAEIKLVFSTGGQRVKREAKSIKREARVSNGRPKSIKQEAKSIKWEAKEYPTGGQEYPTGGQEHETHGFLFTEKAGATVSGRV